jgi:hypothetical protein
MELLLATVPCNDSKLPLAVPSLLLLLLLLQLTLGSALGGSKSIRLFSRVFLVGDALEAWLKMQQNYL